MTEQEIMQLSFREQLKAMHLTQSGCARRFRVPLRTLQGWALGERDCPLCIRLMMAEITGLLEVPEGEIVINPAK